MRRTSSRAAGALLTAAALTATAPAAATTPAAAIRGDGVSVRCHDNAGLVDAVNRANAAGSGTIRLARHCTYTLGEVFPGEYGDNALPRLTGRITIEGNGATLARAAGAPLMRIVEVAGSGAVTIRNTTLANGRLQPGFSFGGNAFVLVPSASLTLAHSRLVGGFARWGGGALNDGPLTLVDSDVTRNSADSEGGGLWNRWTLDVTHGRITRNRGRLGIGGIATGGSTPGPTATTTVRSSTLSDNDGSAVGTDRAMTTLVVDSVLEHNRATPAFPGGAVYNEGTTVVTRGRISGNRSPTSAGAAYNADGSTRIAHSTVSGNSAADDAGGVWGFAGRVLLDHSRVVHNRARRGFGGGILVGPLGRPRATATVTLDHTPVTYNVARRRGGGIYVAHGTLERTASPVKHNWPDDIARAG